MIQRGVSIPKTPKLKQVLQLFYNTYYFRNSLVGNIELTFIFFCLISTYSLHLKNIVKKRILKSRFGARRRCFQVKRLIYVTSYTYISSQKSYTIYLAILQLFFNFSLSKKSIACPYSFFYNSGIPDVIRNICKVFCRIILFRPWTLEQQVRETSPPNCSGPL